MGMVSLDACIYTIIAILGVAYPILLQVISRLDDKYSSVQAVELFDNEPEKKFFVCSLIVSVATVGIWYCKFPPPAMLVAAPGPVVNTLANSALLLVHASTAALIIFFFLLTTKTLTYYNVQKFSGYLQRKHRKNRDDKRHFEILTDIFTAALSAKNSPVLGQIADFFSDEFHQEREAAGTAAVVYSSAYYQLTYRSTEALAILGNRKNKALAHYATGGGWLLGESTQRVLSEETYSALWYNLLIALDYGQDDMIYEYWRTAFQYKEYQLAAISPQYETADFALRVVNADAMAARTQERDRFTEFHHAIGAVLLYSGRAGLLRKLFSFTNSSPPRYELLPDHMSQVFAAFVRYDNAYSLGKPVDITYPFPNEVGVGSEGLIKKWLCLYQAVLFLRQYTLGKYLVFDEPLAYPMLPADQPAKKQWLDSLGYFRRLVTQILQDSRLLQDLSLDFLTEAWCVQQGVEYPLDFIKSLEKLLRAAYQQGAVVLPLSPEKVTEFQQDSARLLDRVVDELKQLAAPASATNFLEARYLRGGRQIVEKDYYSANPEVAHLNFSTVLASQLRSGLSNAVATLFVRNQTTIYNLLQNDLFAALDKLGLNDGYLIINLGVNLSRVANSKGMTDFLPDSYNGVEIAALQTRDYRESLLVIRREDLPQLNFLPLEPAEVEKYSLVPISTRHNLYGAVLDINELNAEVEEEMRNGDFGHFNDSKVKSQALEILEFLLEVKWQKDAKLILLVSHEPNAGSDASNDLAAITSL
jgi:hypothetical protein